MVLRDDARHGDMEPDAWQVALGRQHGLLLLRSCRGRILQEFGSFANAFDKVAFNPSGLDEETPLCMEAFAGLMQAVGYVGKDACDIFDHIAVVAGCLSTPASAESEEERESKRSLLLISQDQFVEALRDAVPIRNLVQLRSRLIQRHGRIDIAFDSSSNSESSLDPASFVSMVEAVNGSASEASKLFAIIMQNNENEPDRQLQVTRRAVLSCLQYAEHLTAAQKFYNHLHQVSHQSTGRRASFGLAASGEGSQGRRGSAGLISPMRSAMDSPRSAGIEELVTAYDAMIELADARYASMHLDLHQFHRAVSVALPRLSRRDVQWLFHLACRGCKSGQVCIQDATVCALGGLGYRLKMLATRVGLDAPSAKATKGTGQRCRRVAARDVARDKLMANA
jgi:hypothetical protein